MQACLPSDTLGDVHSMPVHPKNVHLIVINKIFFFNIYCCFTKIYIVMCKKIKKNLKAFKTAIKK